MKMMSVERCAKSIGISEEDFNEYLKKLKYQIQVLDDSKDMKTIWYMTERGRKHGRVSFNPFNREPLWDIDALFAVMKIRGKITREYFYCDDCGAFLGRQSGFDLSMQKWVCKKCGLVNKLYYDPEDYE